MKTLQTLLLIISFAFSFNAIAQNDVEREGSFTAAFTSWGSDSISGDWKVIQANGKTYIELADNFKAKQGPDVKVFLSPLAASNVTGDNATDGSVFVTQISVFKGKSRIELPAGTQLSDYQSLVVHCEEFSKLWGTSPLS